MADSEPSILYERLMAVRPRDLSPNAWAVKAGVNRTVWTNIRDRGGAHHKTIEKLLGAIGLTFAQFEAGITAPEAERDRKAAPATVTEAPRSFRPLERPRDVPVLGTAACADLSFDSEAGEIDIEALEIDLDEVVDWLARPLALEKRVDVYGIYYTGVSMIPRFEPGEPGYVDPRRMPKAGEYAVVQLAGSDGADGHRVIAAVAKRIVRISGSFVEMEQFNPPARFKIPRERIAAIHRIIPWGELAAF
ncbi:MAG: helix-turn-helix transcriptional regulator [Sphingopyxis terrae]|nr:helix-turn-helix transcriptional regulator [Sphingopyxis terrae]